MMIGIEYYIWYIDIETEPNTITAGILILTLSLKLSRDDYSTGRTIAKRPD